MPGIISFRTQETWVKNRIVVVPMYEGDKFPEFDHFEEDINGDMIGWKDATKRISEVRCFNFGKLGNVTAIEWEEDRVIFEFL